MSKDFSDLIKDFVKIDWSAELDNQSKVFNTPVIKSYVSDMNPDNFAPNRTAKSAEQTVEMLHLMMEASEKEYAERKKHDRALLWISIATLLASLIGAAAAVYQIFD